MNSYQRTAKKKQKNGDHYHMFRKKESSRVSNADRKQKRDGTNFVRIDMRNKKE
jgi:hypothetical protein